MQSILRYFIVLPWLWLGVNMAVAQNLIPNPLFEQISDCQLTLGGRTPLDVAPPWFNPNGARYNDSYLLAVKVCVPAIQWIDAALSDGYIQTYATYVLDAGKVVSNQGTYASTPLTQPLQAGTYYWFSMRAIIALGSTSGIESQEENSFGLLLSTDRPAYPNQNILPITKDSPQLIFTNRRTTERRTTSTGYTDNFAGRQVMQGCFQAQGNEKFITIGDFLHPKYIRRNSALQFTDLSLTKMPDRIDLGPDTSICAGQSVRLNAHFSQYAPTYRWQDGSTDSTLQVTKSGLYSLTITCSCRIYSDSVRVTVRDPGLTVEPDTSVCENKPILLHATLQTPGSSPIRYRWSGGSTAATLTVAKPGLYTIDVEQQDCIYQDSVRVFPSGECCEVNLPTAFSPNADGLNDVFAVITGCSDVIREPELLIYNRWGEVIFRTQELVTGWNGYAQGIACTAGEYTWQLRYALPVRQSLVRQQHRGTVLLIR